MLPLTIVVLMLVSALAAVVYLLGFRLGHESTHERVARVRLDAVDAERRIHELTRNAFVAMLEHVEQQRRGPSPEA